MEKARNSGFSLVELTIVIVIVGLLAAGIAGGKNILHTAKLNNVISEVRGYSTAIDNFREKYNYWPGDMPNATTYWGAYVAATNPTGVINGNGDEVFNNTERASVASHLAKSGFLKGDFIGSGSQHSDDNSMASKSVKGGVYILSSTTDVYNVSGFFIQLKDSNTAGDAWRGIMKPEDVYYIDKKIDDGDSGVTSATSGDLYASRSSGFSANNAANNARCVNRYHNRDPPASYVLTDPDPNCRLFYWMEKR